MSNAAAVTPAAGAKVQVPSPADPAVSSPAGDADDDAAPLTLNGQHVSDQGMEETDTTKDMALSPAGEKNAIAGAGTPMDAIDKDAMDVAKALESRDKELERLRFLLRMKEATIAKEQEALAEEKAARIDAEKNQARLANIMGLLQVNEQKNADRHQDVVDQVKDLRAELTRVENMASSGVGALQEAFDQSNPDMRVNWINGSPGQGHAEGKTNKSVGTQGQQGRGAAAGVPKENKGTPQYIIL